MNEERFTELIAGYFSGNISDTEKELLQAYVEDSAERKAVFEEYQAIWQMTETDPISFQADKSVAWQNIETQIDIDVPKEVKTAKIVRPSFGRQLLRISAVLLVAVAAGLWLYNSIDTKPTQLVEVSTGADEKKELTLPDNSKIWLNENSKVLYAEAFAKREIILQGEAFFDVERLEESPFTIKSGEAQTVVLGTSFNVRAYPQEDFIEVSVVTGKVGFSKPGGATNAVTLEEGEMATLKKEEGRIAKKIQVSSNATSWKTDELIFNNTPIFEVINSLDRYFGIDMKVDNNSEAILNCPFDGRFINSESKLGEIMGSIEFSLINVEVRRDQNTGIYVLSGQGCDEIE